jgi:hypothetical protein
MSHAVSVESTGVLPPRDLFVEAVGILANKARVLIDALDAALAGGEAGGAILTGEAAAAITGAAMRNPEDDEF